MQEITKNVVTPEKFIELQKQLEEIKSDITKIKAQITNSKTKFSDSSDDGVAHSNEDDSHNSIGSYIELIKKYTELVSSLSNITSQLTEMMKECANNISYTAAQYLIKEIQIVALEVKSMMLNLKIKISKQTKEILMAATAWKGAAVTSTVIMPVISQFQTISAILGTALTSIDTIISALPDALSVAAESMALFMTPKSLKKVDIKAINSNNSIADRLPDPVKSSIQQIMKTTDKLNIPIKVSSIAASGAAGLAAAKSDDISFSLPEAKKLNLLDHMNLTNMVEAVVSLLPIPQGLPKYEKLSITNVGFDAFLMTSFCLGGKQSFGFPGMP